MTGKDSNNVARVFAMDLNRFREWTEYLNVSAGIAHPEYHRARLNTEDASDIAGDKYLKWGLAGCLFVITFGGWTWYWFARGYPVYWLLLGVFPTLVLAGYGWSKLVTSHRIQAAALEDVYKLEGDDGFLWRFEQLLAQVSKELPEPVTDTLPGICRSSKDKSVLEAFDQTTMRTYWYWSALLKRHMDHLVAEYADQE